LQIGLLIHTQYHLPVGEWAGIEVNDLLNLFDKLLITRDFGRQPEMMSPRFELMRLQDTADRLGRDTWDNSISDELASQVRAIPLGE